MDSGTAVEAREAVRQPADKARRDARAGRGWYSTAARLGLVAKGVSYGLVAVLAFELALGHGGKAASRGGALQTLADDPLGKLAIGALAVGFALYAVWRFVQAFAEPQDPSEGEAKGEAKKWGKRAGYVARGLIYASLTYSAVKILLGAHEESQNQTARKSTDALFDLPAGRWLVGLAGLAIIGAGLWNIYRGLSKKFEDKWRGAMSRAEHRWGGRAGVVGHVARGVVFGLIGIFIAKAALEYDPDEAIGLDGALQKLAGTSHGAWLLGLTALGLFCYAIFCLVDARYRDVSAGS